MSYTVNFTEQALADADRLERDEPKAYQKFLGFLNELAEHPKTFGSEHLTFAELLNRAPA